MTTRKITAPSGTDSIRGPQKNSQGWAFQTVNRHNERQRRQGFKWLTLCAVLPLLLALGCASGNDIRQAEKVAVVDVSQDAQKGYVEFYSTSHTAPFPIFLVDDLANPRTLGGIGVNSGDDYSYARHGTSLADRLRVGLAPGEHTFMVEQEGEIVKATVASGQVTPVEIDYVLLEEGDTFRVYRVRHQVGRPESAKETATAK